jgi:hypothetical protein
MQRGAIISDCGAFRYRLWREWDAALRRPLMLPYSCTPVPLAPSAGQQQENRT